MSCYAKFTKDIFLKKKATSTNDTLIWKEFKGARNKVNNSIKKAKRKYISEKLDLSKSLHVSKSLQCKCT